MVLLVNGFPMKKAVILAGGMVLCCSLLNMGTIRKKEDPILKTQTEPISYKQKMEEMKDGPKGAPMPSFNLYPKERFFTDPAVGPAKAEEAKDKVSDQANVPEVEEVSPEEGSEDWWSEEGKDSEPPLDRKSNPDQDAKP